ncbi:MAG: myo-inosose-2 dehydratase [Xanthomonadales bacterium]|nr:myo-inosose-2 dehydratase [Xanthomonadales bacterium]
MSIRIGINPLTWTNDDMPELGADTPLATCLSEGAEAGYEGFELGNKFPRDPAVLGPVLDSHGLALVSGWYSSCLLERSVEEEIEAVQSHLHLLKSLGATVMVFAETTGAVHGMMDTPVANRPVMTDAQWTLFISRLEAVAGYLSEQGVQMAYHHHMGTVIESERDIDRLMSSTGPTVGLLLDTGHLTYAGGDLLKVIGDHGARINHVHCKDIRPQVLQACREERRSFLESVLAGVFTVPGDGCIDYQAVWSSLQAMDYQGWLVVEAEQDPAIATPLKYARMGYEHLAGIVGRIT